MALNFFSPYFFPYPSLTNPTWSSISGPHPHSSKTTILGSFPREINLFSIVPCSICSFYNYMDCSMFTIVQAAYIHI